MKDNYVKGRFLVNIFGKVECVILGIVEFAGAAYFLYLLVCSAIKKMHGETAINAKLIIYMLGLITLLVIALYFIVDSLLLLTGYSVSISIQDNGIQYRWASIVNKTLQWDEFISFTIKEIKHEMVIVCLLRYKPRGFNAMFYKNLKLYIYPNAQFVAALRNKNIKIYNE